MRSGPRRAAGAPRAHWIAGACAALLVLGAAAPAGAQILKLGYVDSVRIFDGYTLAKDSQQRFAREIEAWRVDSDERRKALEQLRAEAHEQSLGLSEEKRVEKEAELEKAQADYDQFVQAFWGPNGKAAQLNQQLTQEIIQKVRDVVERIAHDEAYDLILDAADGNVIFAVKSLDLTDRVIEILNKEAGTPTTGGQP
jgi:Skp family chaperone for outer membrane proteins